jgi:hypothetical protein
MHDKLIDPSSCVIRQGSRIRLGAKPRSSSDSHTRHVGISPLFFSRKALQHTPTRKPVLPDHLMGMTSSPLVALFSVALVLPLLVFVMKLFSRKNHFVVSGRVRIPRRKTNFSKLTCA